MIHTSQDIPATADGAGNFKIINRLAQELGEARNSEEQAAIIVQLVQDCLDAAYGCVCVDLGEKEPRVIWSQTSSLAAESKREAERLLLSSLFRKSDYASAIGPDGAATRVSQAVMLVANVDSDQRNANGSTAIGSTAIGSIGAVVQCSARSERDRAFAHLRSLAAFVHSTLQAVNKDSQDRGLAAQLAIEKIDLGRPTTTHQFYQSLADELKWRLGLAEVSVASVSGQEVTLECVSAIDRSMPTEDLRLVIQDALTEAVDFQSMIIADRSGSQSDQDANCVHFLHQNWTKQVSGEAVASIPVFRGDDCCLAIGIQAKPGQRITLETLAAIESWVHQLVPWSESLKAIEEQQVRPRLMNGIRGTYWHKRWRFLGWTFAALAIAWLAIGELPHQLTVPCELSVTEETHLSAPVSGVLESADVHPGQRCAKGQLLLQFNVDALQRERIWLQQQTRQSRIAMIRAIELQNLAKAAQEKARGEEMSVRLGAVEMQIQNASVRAPADGAVIEADLEQRVGQSIALGEPLLRYASSGQLHVRIAIPDAAIDEVQIGQTVAVTLASRPDTEMSLIVDQIAAEAILDGGRSVFLVEASAQNDVPAWMRSGMQGIAQIRLGKRPAWQSLLQSSLDRFRLYF